jgi:hypothetical protein
VGVRLLEQEFVPLRGSLSACFFAPSSLFLLGADSCLLLLFRSAMLDQRCCGRQCDDHRTQVSFERLRLSVVAPAD